MSNLQSCILRSLDETFDHKVVGYVRGTGKYAGDFYFLLWRFEGRQKDLERVYHSFPVTVNVIGPVGVSWRLYGLYCPRFMLFPLSGEKERKMILEM